jgi:predicted  nucleic acid-binding Zn-ribbon protein
MSEIKTLQPVVDAHVNVLNKISDGDSEATATAQQEFNAAVKAAEEQVSKDLDAATKEVEAVKANQADLEAKIVELTGENESLKDQFTKAQADAQAERESFEAQISELNEKLTAAATENETLLEQNKKLSEATDTPPPSETGEKVLDLSNVKDGKEFWAKLRKK